MSLYIGNNGSEKVLHIYDGSSNVEKTPFSGTSFHSSLPYFMFKSVHRFTPTSGQISVVHGYKVTYSTTTPLVSGNDVVVVRGYYNGTTYTFPSSIGEGYFNGTQGVYYGSTDGNCPAFQLTDMSNGFYCRTGYEYVSPIPGTTMFGVPAFDYIDIYVFSNNTTPIIPSDVKLSNSDIVINSTSIMNNTYIHFMRTINDRVNDYDTIIPIPFGTSNGRSMIYTQSSGNLTHSANGGYMLIQLINSYNYASTSIQLMVDSSTKINTIKNAKTITLFDSNVTYKTKYTSLGTHLVVVKGQAFGSGVTAAYTISLAGHSGKVLLIKLSYSTDKFNTKKDLFIPFEVIANNMLTLDSSYRFTIYCTVSASADSIMFYVRDLSSATLYATKNFYITIFAFD